jgi:hypothetical protein
MEDHHPSKRLATELASPVSKKKKLSFFLACPFANLFILDPKRLLQRRLSTLMSWKR